jgi:glycosyltransferase involved in cell wall biosynthesis
MKIVHVSESLRVGGAEVLVAQMCRQMRAWGRQVEAYTLDARGDLVDVLRAEGFRVVVGEGGSRWRMTKALVKEFSRFRPDVVHCHNAMATIVAAPAARWAGVPVVVSTRHGLVAPPFGWRREMQFGLASQLCRAVAGVCRATTVNLARAPLAARDRLVTVYNGAAEASDGPATVPERRSALTLVWVGRLAPPKDPFTLIRALAEARRRHGADIALWVVGDGALRAPAQVLCDELGLHEAVTFLGEQAWVRPFLKAADAFVLSSESEGLPVSMIEAMAAGKACLVTAAGAMPELIEDGRCGLVTAVGDVAGMAEALAELACDEASRQGWGEAARRYYESGFTLEKMTERYLELYERRAG